MPPQGENEYRLTFRPSTTTTVARFQVGQRVRKSIQGRSSMPVGTSFVITNTFPPHDHRGWGYSGAEYEATGGAWEDELDLDEAFPSQATRFLVGQRVIKARHIRSRSVPVGLIFTVDSVLRTSSSDGRCNTAYTGGSVRSGVWEDELEAYRPVDADRDDLEPWERELLRAGATPPPLREERVIVGTPNKVLKTGSRVAIEVQGPGNLQRLLTRGQLFFDDNGEPYIRVYAESWPTEGVS